MRGGEDEGEDGGGLPWRCHQGGREDVSVTMVNSFPYSRLYVSPNEARPPEPQSLKSLKTSESQSLESRSLSLTALESEGPHSLRVPGPSPETPSDIRQNPDVDPALPPGELVLYTLCIMIAF